MFWNKKKNLLYIETRKYIMELVLVRHSALAEWEATNGYLKLGYQIYKKAHYALESRIIVQPSVH